MKRVHYFYDNECDVYTFIDNMDKPNKTILIFKSMYDASVYFTEHYGRPLEFINLMK